MRTYKICVFTGTRAEYGLLKPLMEEIQKQPEFELQIVASCMHLSPEFGLTYQEIEKDGFKIDEKVEMLLSSDTPVGTVKSMGVGMIGYADALSRLKPDMVIVLGDRFEALAFAISSYILRIPIAHLYGGEITEGVLDQGFRDAISVISDYHFVSNSLCKERLINFGIPNNRVFEVGELGIDNIKKMELLSKKELESELKLKLKKINLLVTYHPVTAEKGKSIYEFKSLLRFLQVLIDEKKDIFIIFTYSNADPEGRQINKLIDEFVNKNSNNSRVFANLGQKKYLSLLKYIDVVIGNSSSGIVEAPLFKKPTINIGNRQKGRLKSSSIIDVSADERELKNAFNIVLDKKIKKFENLYGDGHSAEKIVKILKYILVEGGL